eukprot:6184836-Pleurochrysis_carterae.AAC.7
MLNTKWERAASKRQIKGTRRRLHAHLGTRTVTWSSCISTHEGCSLSLSLGRAREIASTLSSHTCAFLSLHSSFSLSLSLSLHSFRLEQIVHHVSFRCEEPSLVYLAALVLAWAHARTCSRLQGVEQDVLKEEQTLSEGSHASVGTHALSLGQNTRQKVRSKRHRTYEGLQALGYICSYRRTLQAFFVAGSCICRHKKSTKLLITQHLARSHRALEKRMLHADSACLCTCACVI